MFCRLETAFKIHLAQKFEGLRAPSLWTAWRLWSKYTFSHIWMPINKIQWIEHCSVIGPQLTLCQEFNGQVIWPIKMLIFQFVRQINQTGEYINIGGLVKLHQWWHLSAVETFWYLLMFINVYFVLYQGRDDWFMCHLHCSNLSRHNEEPQNSIYCLHFLKIKINFHTKNNLLYLVCQHVSFLFALPLFTAGEHNVWCESALACWTY